MASNKSGLKSLWKNRTKHFYKEHKNKIKGLGAMKANGKFSTVISFPPLVLF